MLERLLGPLARRWAWIATALTVQKRFGEVRGGYLASAVTLTLFLSVFPLLLVAIAALGFVTGNDQNTTQRIVENLGLTGEWARIVADALTHAGETKQTASVIGLLGLLWSGLGVVAALEYALDATWQQTGRGIKDKLRALLWCAGGAVLLGGSIAVTASIRLLFDGIALDVLSIIAALVVNFGFWIWTFASLAYERVQWKAYVPGAVLAAVGFELIKQIATYLPQLFQGSSALYGSIGAVFGLLTVIALFGRITVYASVLNVVRWEEDHGTVTVEVDLPRIAGEVPLSANRSGAAEPPIAGG